MQILTKAFTEIYKAKNVPLSLRIDCYSFFFRCVHVQRRRWSASTGALTGETRLPTLCASRHAASIRARRYLLFAGLVAVVLLVPPIVLWIEPWQWQWPEIFFMVSVNMGLVLYL